MRRRVNMKTRGVIAIDPSSTCTGWAVWNNLRSDGPPKSWAPDFWGEVKRPKGEKDFGSILYLMADHLGEDLNSHARVPPKHVTVVIEWPQKEGGQRGHAADLVKLSGAAGMCLTAAMAYADQSVLVPPVAWKGDLSKQRTKAEAIEYLDGWEPEKLGLDGWDAVGLGLWHITQGDFLK